ncbi:SIR2 family NAD-dependent protein deacylase [Allopontixanthobacter sediminis]|uniref:SIR2-like domain-containing protein n=1 Tax=Allopontixanthobacter sediminis TaxID=1689985 RepID=A0A845B376_9SPHN|nr:SIR2 family protein [Allopontixanthobacter sediminis]MXP44850.1 hypothetical protein [Allopontixanthobacter sediminis]
MEEYFRQRFIDELNEEGDIEIRTKVWSRAEVLAKMDQDIFNGLLVDWVAAERANACDQVMEFLDENGCRDRLEALIHRIKQGAVIPFVGAGMSCASGHRLWGDFLKSLLADAPDRVQEIDAFLVAAQYEEAAQAVHDILGPVVLAEEVFAKLGSHKRRVDGPVQLLPRIFGQEVVTTNFDYVLTHAYHIAGIPFANTFSGAALRDAPGRIGNEPHCLLRLHGEADTAHGRVLTSQEYSATYTEQRTLAEVINAITGTKSLLFLGCSLTDDRTVEALKHLHANAPVGRPLHYAFLPLPENDRQQRREFLAEAGIHPIYYPTDAHDQMIEQLLITLLEGVA